jgi:hypothetical protein
MPFCGWRKPAAEFLHPLDVYAAHANPNGPFRFANIDFAHYTVSFIDQAATNTLHGSDSQ